MGTRADFYIGRGEGMTWLGSIAWDGYPDGIDAEVREAHTPEGFTTALHAFFDGRDDVTLPDQGWPWPWDTSHTTDYAYALDDGTVYASCFGHEWFVASEHEPDDERTGGKTAVFPDMSDHKAVARGKRSGLITITSEGVE